MGQEITLTGSCTLEPVTAVRICGLPAPIISRTMHMIVVAVPVGATGACQVEVQSPAGLFIALGTLTVG